MKYLVKTLASLFLASSFGCAIVMPPTTMEFAQANYGNYPDNPASAVESYMGDHLFDPTSLLMTNPSSVQKGAFLSTSGPIFGYIYSVSINAKNKFGGYTGAQVWFYLIKDSKVVAATTDEALGKGAWQWAP